LFDRLLGGANRGEPYGFHVVSSVEMGAYLGLVRRSPGIAIYRLTLFSFKIY
jgi:hypothetical protein